MLWNTVQCSNQGSTNLVARGSEKERSYLRLSEYFSHYFEKQTSTKNFPFYKHPTQKKWRGQFGFPFDNWKSPYDYEDVFCHPSVRDNSKRHEK